MTAAGASARQPRSAPALRAAIFTALAAGLALCAISPALAQDEPPAGPSATIGALGAAPAAPEAAAAAASVAPTPEEVTLPAAPAATGTPQAVVAAAPSASAAGRGASASPPAAASAAATPAGVVANAPATPSAAAATPTPAASAGASAPADGPKTFLINDAAPGSTPSGWSPVAPTAPGSRAPEGSPTKAATGASVPAANAPAAEELREDLDAPSIGTTVIPSAQQQAIRPGTGVAPESSQIVNYEANQQMPLNEPQLHSLQEFMNEGVNASPLGVELQEGARRGKNGREVDGLLVVALQPGSPAERAGVMAGHRQAHDVVEGVAVAASLVFPPAVLVVPVIETIQLGENYDLIIGVDGNRVTNFMDFQDQLREAQPGETVYLNILRGGKRLQLPVEMPKPNPSKLSP
jgi:hypothetical protein